MNDWRITNQEKYLKKVNLLRIKFPEYWQKAFEENSYFFQKVFAEAVQHVEKLNKSKSYLKEDRCKDLWHRHCDFCMEEISIGRQEECYCTVNYNDWICKDCFNDFKKHFEWNVLEGTEAKDSQKGAIDLNIILVKP